MPYPKSEVIIVTNNLWDKPTDNELGCLDEPLSHTPSIQIPRERNRLKHKGQRYARDDLNGTRALPHRNGTGGVEGRPTKEIRKYEHLTRSGKSIDDLVPYRLKAFRGKKGRT